VPRLGSAEPLTRVCNSAVTLNTKREYSIEHYEEKEKEAGYTKEVKE